MSALMLAASLVAGTPAACSNDLETGQNKLAIQDVVGARPALERAASASCRSSVRSEAVIALARIHWRIDAKPELALRELRAIRALASEPCTVTTLQGRILLDAGKPAMAFALSGRELGCDETEPATALNRLAARVELATQGKGTVSEARAELASLSPIAAITLDAARARLAIGLFAQDADEALRGWRQYFWLGDAPDAVGLVGSSTDERGIFVAGLGPGASVQGRIALIRRLIRGGFATEARRLWEDGAAGRVRARDVTAYFRMRDRIDAALLTYNRARARGLEGAEGELEPRLLAIMGDAVTEAEAPTKDLWPALRRIWGLVGTTGSSNDVQGLHLGHVTDDSDRQVIQGRRTGTVGFISLDNMIANGFMDWLTDGELSTGGWATDKAIVQVRPLYIGGAINRAAISQAGPARTRFLARLKRESVDDQPPADPAVITFLQSVSDRLRLRAIDELATEVRGEGVSSAEFVQRFAQLWYERSLEGTIVFHEGRHALDQIEFTGDRALTSPELEYRAKLSELALSRSPMIMLGSIYSPLLGGDSGHGIANERLLRALVQWMIQNHDSIAGFDSSKPALAQLDLLSDEQLRVIARSLDPEKS